MDIHDRIFEIGLQLYAEDFSNLQRAVREKKQPFAGKSGKENSQLRGLIMLVLNAEQIPQYTRIHAELCAREFGGVDIFDPVFLNMFSHYQSEDSDRARVVANTTDTKYELIHDSTIRNEAVPADKRLRELFPEAVKSFEETARKLGRSEYYQIDESFVYERLLARAFRGSEAKRIETAVNLAMGLETTVTLTRQSVVPDVSDKFVSVHGQPVLLSHLGTSEVIELGPYGLQRRALLRTQAKANPANVLGEVWGDAECRTTIPVVCQLEHYTFDIDAQRVTLEGSEHIPSRYFRSIA